MHKEIGINRDSESLQGYGEEGNEAEQFLLARADSAASSSSTCPQGSYVQTRIPTVDAFIWVTVWILSECGL